MSGRRKPKVSSAERNGNRERIQEVVIENLEDHLNVLLDTVRHAQKRGLGSVSSLQSEASCVAAGLPGCGERDQDVARAWLREAES